MIDLYFESEVRRRQLRRGPLAKHIDGLATELQRQSYARNTARRILSIMGQASCYAGLVGASAEEIDEGFVRRFLDAQFVADGLYQDGPSAMRHVLRYLRKQGIIALEPPPIPHPFAPTLERFDAYLRDVRGQAAKTRRMYLSNARALVDRLGEPHGNEAVQRLTGIEVLDFITQRVGRLSSRSSRGHVCSLTRGFLRYLHATGAIASDLARAVPRVSTPRLASLPRRLRWDQVRMVLDGVETSHPDGLRDKAILLLLAILGFRSNEVRSLELGQIAWQAGEIRLPFTKTRRERVLPLVPEIGAALANYLLYGRPPVAVPQVFLRHGPRPASLTSNAVVWIVRRHLGRAGIRVPRAGAHMLRHSLATQMVNAGVPIKSVADVLGHASIDTTAIYTKVDERTLAAVALPFPGGAR